MAGEHLVNCQGDMEASFSPQVRHIWCETTRNAIGRKNALPCRDTRKGIVCAVKRKGAWATSDAPGRLVITSGASDGDGGDGVASGDAGARRSLQ